MKDKVRLQKIDEILARKVTPGERILVVKNLKRAMGRIRCYVELILLCRLGSEW